MPRTPPSEPLVLAEFLPYRLSIIAERTSRVFAERYGDAYNLGVPEWRVLAILGQKSPRTTQDVIDCTEMDRVKVSRAAIRLEDRALIARAPHPTDGRAHVLSLTPHGASIYARIVPMAHEVQNELAGMLTQDEYRQLDRILGKLQKKITG